MTYRERREARAERLRTWADKRVATADGIAKADARIRADLGFVAAQPGIGRLPAFKRMLAREEREYEHRTTAADFDRRAGGIEDQLATSIYDDDDDAIEALTAKLAGLEAERERIKTFNAAVRKAKGDAAAIAAALEVLPANERANFLSICRLTPYHKPTERGFPTYHLTNLGGNIRRVAGRLEELKKRANGERRYRLLTVKWAGKCATCGAAIEKGADAYYEKAERALYCGRGCLV